MARPGRLFIFGLGFSAGVLARRLMAEGWSVAGTTRSEDKRAALMAQGIEAYRFDRDTPLPAPRMCCRRCRPIRSAIRWWSVTAPTSRR
jgi:nucleoside-diphosphate-sugar epimerase